MSSTPPPNTVCVQVAVPKGKRARRMGVFIQGKGVFPVEVPYNLQFGDEFELYLSKAQLGLSSEGQLSMNKVERIALPDGLGPGSVFKHRVPNGKFISISCPPGVTDGCYLLVPWSEQSNEHFIVQAQVAPKEEVVPKRNSYQARGGKKKNAQQNSLDDDLRLAQTLSFTTLQPADLEMENIIKRSLLDYQHKPSPPPTEDELLVQRVLKESMADRSEDDDAFETALQASLKDYSKGTPQIISPTSAKQPVFSPDDEEEMLKKVAELSLKEAYANSAAATILKQYGEPHDTMQYDEGKINNQIVPSLQECDEVDTNSTGHQDDADKQYEERMAFLQSLPPDILQEVLKQETLQEQALTKIQNSEM